MGEAGETPWPRGAHTGGAWLSSARVVRCWVKSRNERNPRRVLPAVRPGTRARPPASSRRKVGTTSSHHAPYALGCTRATMAGTEGCHPARGSGSRKAGPSSDWGLQPAPMKSELLVIADQHAAVNAFPGLVHTARHTTRVVCTRSRRPNREGGGAEGVEGEGGEVVTR